MASSTVAGGQETPGAGSAAGAARWLAINYAVTIFVSAFLLFQVQPLVSKFILPWFGGSPAVWTTCMLFFQTLLFCGYAYAHFSQVWLAPRRQGLVHLGLIVLAVGALAVLGVVPGAGWEPRESGDPVGQILLMLAASVGLPYFVLSSTGPLMQAWFVRTFVGSTPYRLYALSNVGSLLALLSYPFFFERIWAVPEQARFWSIGFCLYAALCGAAALALWQMYRGGRGGGVTALEGAEAGGILVAEGAGEDGVARPRWWERVLWLVLPAFASVTLLATTNHVCTDVAVMPFLWVVPLSLYLVTFIVAFDHPRWYRPGLVAAFTLAAIYAVGTVEGNGMGTIDLHDCGTPGKLLKMLAGGSASPQFDVNFITALVLNFAAMFGMCMLCHGELVRLRPHPRYLTSFYLMIAAGGALGGAAVSLAAPHVFTRYLEFELSLYVGAAVAVGLLMRALVGYVPRSEAGGVGRGSKLIWAVGMPLVFGALVFTDLYDHLAYSDKGVLMRSRNFFGTLAVRERDVDQPEEHDYVLQHGRITHGVQFAAADRRHEPTTYYNEGSGVGLAVAYYAARADEATGGMRIGAVGLGAGTLATYVAKGDSISFYEINPAIIEIAEPPKWFTFLADCRGRGGNYDIRLGDARLVLKRELEDKERKPYDVLVLDAFSGDAIPAHLLTEEAFEIYMQHLATAAAGGREGAIAVHISNRYADLEPVVRGLAERFGLQTARVKTERDTVRGIYASDWIIMSRDPALIAGMESYTVEPDSNPKPAILWTDARSNLFDVLK